MSNNIFLQNQIPQVPQFQNPFQVLTTGSSQNALLPPLQTQVATLNLNQIQGFEPVKEFTDSTNTHWTLVKNSADSTIDIPDPSSLQVVSSWCHEFPNVKKTKVYLYVVEGVRLPRVETEKPARILYQWFAMSFVPTFSHTMITKKEWLKANVYAAPVQDARVSQMYALCKVSSNGDAKEEPQQPDKLLTIEELVDVENVE